jgi:beta-aspartyl-peptidase (threonine type)
MTASNGWSIILHGGAKTIPSGKEDAHRKGLQQALSVGRELLTAGSSALETVEAVVRKLEDIPVFNAGTGAVRNAAGTIELDASIMDGATLEIGAVAGVQGFRNPVRIARAFLREKAIFLVGEGATHFARSIGAEPAVHGEEQSAGGGCDTVGCVVRDDRGDLAVATSTGGLEGAAVGRVGDVPLPGCGFYADNRRGALSLSGEGEAIARVMLAAEALMRMQQDLLENAIDDALELLLRVNGEAGIIAILPDGRIGWGHNSDHFAVAWATASEPSGTIALRKER